MVVTDLYFRLKVVYSDMLTFFLRIIAISLSLESDSAPRIHGFLLGRSSLHLSAREISPDQGLEGQ